MPAPGPESLTGPILLKNAVDFYLNSEEAAIVRARPRDRDDERVGPAAASHTKPQDSAAGGMVSNQLGQSLSSPVPARTQHEADHARSKAESSPVSRSLPGHLLESLLVGVASANGASPYGGARWALDSAHGTGPSPMVRLLHPIDEHLTTMSTVARLKELKQSWTSISSIRRLHTSPCGAIGRPPSPPARSAPAMRPEVFLAVRRRRHSPRDSPPPAGRVRTVHRGGRRRWKREQHHHPSRAWLVRAVDWCGAVDLAAVRQAAGLPAELHHGRECQRSRWQRSRRRVQSRHRRQRLLDRASGPPNPQTARRHRRSDAKFPPPVHS